MSILQRNQVFEALREELQSLKKEADFSHITEESHFKDDMGLDSLDIVEFVARAEIRYRVHVPDEDFAGLDTLGKVIDYVLSRLP